MSGGGPTGRANVGAGAVSSCGPACTALGAGFAKHRTTLRIRLQIRRMIPCLVLGFWDKNHRDMRRRQAISPGFSSHYQNLGISSLKEHDSTCNRILSVASNSKTNSILKVYAGAPNPGWDWAHNTDSNREDVRLLEYVRTQHSRVNCVPEHISA